MIGLVCESFWRVADGRVEEFKGDLDEYAAWLRSRGSEAKSAKGDKSAAKTEPVKAQRSKQIIDADVKRLKQLESRIATLQSEAKHIDDELADPAVYASDGGGTVVRLAQRQGELQKEREVLESEWLLLYEAQEA